jgi:hypothetical protein
MNRTITGTLIGAAVIQMILVLGWLQHYVYSTVFHGWPFAITVSGLAVIAPVLTLATIRHAGLTRATALLNIVVAAIWVVQPATALCRIYFIVPHSIWPNIVARAIPALGIVIPSAIAGVLLDRRRAATPKNPKGASEQPAAQVQSEGAPSD